MGRLALAALVALAQAWADDSLPMNRIQVLGSHNSYKQAIDASLWKLLNDEDPHRFLGLEYEHLSLTEQLDLGLRNLELDVVHDPEGGRYAKPYGIELVRRAGLPPGPPFDPQGLMARPGLKVLHVPDIDFRTHVYTLQQALAELKAWSRRHPRHLPIAVTMNAKDAGVARPGFVEPLPFDRAAYNAWDAELVAGLGRERLIAPDDVRRSRASLAEAIRADGWPSLAQARGKFLFILDEHGDKAETYIGGDSSLAGRAMFPLVEEGRPEAAVFVVNDPVRDFERIRSLVEAGHIVRTRADADTREARTGDTARREAAFASGAQIVTTDYYRENPAFGTGYRVEPPCRCAGWLNPLFAPPGASQRPLE